MQFGPETPRLASLGGSETAALMMGKALAARGHDVTHFCNLPGPERPDHIASGTLASDGVRYVSLQHFEQFAPVNPHDVLIVLRDPKLVAVPALAKKKVLWCHDIATKRGYGQAFSQMQFTFDEVWTVSEWHKYQLFETTQYPELRVVALRNGIVKHDDIINTGGVPKQLLYAARPERGLESLVRPGGIMEHLPEYTLTVVCYEHFPEHMRPYYERIFAWMKRLPNVKFVGGKPNAELRQMIADSEAYIYPTNFEETSCILARECIEQCTPFLTTSVGALPETLGDCGIYFEDWLHENGITEPDRGSDGWCKLFAQFFREGMNDSAKLKAATDAMALRDDLYWDGVAEMAEEHLEPPRAGEFSRIWSLLQDGDAIAALAFRDELGKSASPYTTLLDSELAIYRKMLEGGLDRYYDESYQAKGGTEESELHFNLDCTGARFQAIAQEVAKLPTGSKVFEYGCGPAHLLAPLAKSFPHIAFVGYDFARSAIDVVQQGAHDNEIANLLATADLAQVPKEFDLVICSEVLEHVERPWELLQQVEAYAKPGARVAITVPFGAWEPISYERPGHWSERFHLWSIDYQMIKDMVGEKEGESFAILLLAQDADYRPRGNYFFAYTADHKPVLSVDPYAKAMRHHCRHTAAAAVIAYNNEDTILKMLNSLDHQVQLIQIAHGPSKDKTASLVQTWAAEHPWVRVCIFDVPKIEPRKFGFDDARNASTGGITSSDFEWVLWIDTDEYLSGDIRRYLRDSALDGYMVAQHHFTCEPRGRAVEIDYPARLMRTDRGYKCFGKIHEHFEIARGNRGQGPGIVMPLPDVDIGHTGYVNENVRRSRFHRNFSFLEWDHEQDPPRKLHHFLWLRDIIHRMRFDEQNRVRLAQEAVDYYTEWQPEMATFGPGLFQSLQYLGEAYAILGKGVPIQFQVRIGDEPEGKSAAFGGRFENFDQVNKVMRQLLIPEFDDRKSRYY